MSESRTEPDASQSENVYDRIRREQREKQEAERERLERFNNMKREGKR